MDGLRQRMKAGKGLCHRMNTSKNANLTHTSLVKKCHFYSNLTRTVQNRNKDLHKSRPEFVKIFMGIFLFLFSLFLKFRF